MKNCYMGYQIYFASLANKHSCLVILINFSMNLSDYNEKYHMGYQIYFTFCTV